MNRRYFLRQGLISTVALTIVPNYVVSGLGHKVPSDKLNIAGIGIGGRGKKVLNFMKDEQIVALCDVDWKYAKQTFLEYPRAKQYIDYKRLFDEMAKDIDAVVVATPDHTHAVIASAAMALGKHVYCEKPLTHSVYESRYLTKMAEETKVATQMGNQGSSGEGIRQICEWIWNGEIGEVKEVHAWTNRPIWPQGLQRPTLEMSVPETLSWDLFIGPAKYRPYNEVYTPWNWRGWWNFGTGALGDMACHILDPVFKSLKLKYPTKVIGSSTQVNTECAPHSERIRFTFPARERMMHVNMPEVTVHWYDGGFVPNELYELPEGVMTGKEWENGVIFKGTKDMLICGCYSANPFLASGRIPVCGNLIPRVETQVKGWNKGDHQKDWIRACKEDVETRIEACSNFAYAGPFNEMVAMGVLAVRLQSLHKDLLWDGEAMRFSNIHDTEKLKIVKTDTFSVNDGHPTFKTDYATFDAQEMAEEMIKHTYREAWSLS